jgi:hypothetical protein
MDHFSNHATQIRRVIVLDGLVHPTKPQRLDRCAMLLLRGNHTLGEGDSQFLGTFGACFFLSHDLLIFLPAFPERQDFFWALAAHGRQGC